MSLKMRMSGSTGSFSRQVEKLREVLDQTGCVVIGAGAGLSTSAGLTYDGPRFEKYFSDFARKYGISDMYSGGFYPFPDREEFWAWWSRHIWVNRYLDPPRPVYDLLLNLVREKDYFVITTNVDHCFQKAGFSRERLFYTQGDYGLWQCSGPCCQETFDNGEAVRQMLRQQRDMRIPSELIPHCPHCGRPMAMNLRADDTFVEDEGWHQAARRCQNFLETRGQGPILFLELGVGWNTPGIIKYPFWRMTRRNGRAVYCTVNFSEAVCPEEIRDRSICIRGDILEALQQLTRQRDVSP